MFVLLNGGKCTPPSLPGCVPFHSLMFVLLNGGSASNAHAPPFTKFHSLMFVLLNGGWLKINCHGESVVSLADVCVTEWRAALGKKKHLSALEFHSLMFVFTS